MVFFNPRIQEVEIGGSESEDSVWHLALPVNLWWWPHPLGVVSGADLTHYKVEEGLTCLSWFSESIRRAETAYSGAGRLWQLFTLICVSASLINTY